MYGLRTDPDGEPPLLRRVVDAFGQRSVPFAIGGSVLLKSLGLTERANDWDLTTDADPSVVRSALEDFELPFRDRSGVDGVFASAALFTLTEARCSIDIIVRLTLLDGNVPIRFPSIVSHHWNDLPMASPRVWAEAYRLMGRTSKAEALGRCA